jgi:hypothetical protein
MKTKFLGNFSLFLFISLTAACGGSGGGDGGDERSGTVEITDAYRCAVQDYGSNDHCVSEKIEGDRLETDQSAIHLSGLSFAARVRLCPEPTSFDQLYCLPTHNYGVTWINLTNGASWDASIRYQNQITKVDIVSWNTYNRSYADIYKGIPLKKGPNTIRITATNWSFIREAEITITRVVDVTPPIVHSHALSWRGLEVFFTEQLDPASVVTSIRVVDENGQPVPGTIRYDPRRLRVVWGAESSLNKDITYTARISGVTDWAPNVMIDPYEWSFKGQDYGPELAVL